MGDHQRIPTVVCFASFFGGGKLPLRLTGGLAVTRPLAVFPINLRECPEKSPVLFGSPDLGASMIFLAAPPHLSEKDLFAKIICDRLKWPNKVGGYVRIDYTT